MLPAYNSSHIHCRVCRWRALGRQDEPNGSGAFVFRTRKGAPRSGPPPPPRACPGPSLAQPREAAANSLRQTLHVARRVFDPDHEMGTRYLASQDEVLPLSPDSTLWVDVDAFEEAAKAARRSAQRQPECYLRPSYSREEWLGNSHISTGVDDGPALDRGRRLSVRACTRFFA